MQDISLPTIDFKRDKFGIQGKVIRIERFANNPVPLALVKYDDGEERYILAASGLRIGDSVKSGNDAAIKPGNTLSLKIIPPEILIHNIELKPGNGGQLVRAPGSAAKIIELKKNYCVIKLPSGRIVKVHGDCKATIGRVAQADELIKLSEKAQIRLDYKGQKPSAETKNLIPGKQENNNFESVEENPEKSEDCLLTCKASEIIAATGQVIDLIIEAKNTGSNIWTEEQQYRLGWLRGYEYFGKLKPLVLCLGADERIMPNSSKIWQIPGIVLPSKPGNYMMVWQMYKKEFSWFGNKMVIKANVDTKTVEVKSLNKQVSVVSMEVKTPNVKTIPVSSGSFAYSGTMEKQGVPSLFVNPTTGPLRTKFKITASGCTPKAPLILNYEAYLINSGWKIFNRSLNSDKDGRASAVISWDQPGTYDIWIKDVNSDSESPSLRITVV